MCWDETMHFEHLSRLRQSKSKSGVKGWGWEWGGGGGVREKGGERKLQEPRLLHFAPYFNYPSCHFNKQSELCALGNDFTRECIAKGGFVAVEHEKIFATKCRCRDSHKGGRKPNVNVKKKKNSSCRFCRVNFTSGGGRGSFENLFSSLGRVESAGLILAHC